MAEVEGLDFTGLIGLLVESCRVPQSVLANHYTDFSPERLREVYEKANLKVLES